MTQALRRWTFRGLLLSLVLGLCVFLFIKTRAVDFASHAATVDSLRHIQQLNAVLQQQVLASRFGLLNSYDELARTEDELTRSMSDLGQKLTRSRKDGGEEMARALARLLEVGSRRALDLEQFKSQNAILKNSLYFLPTAGEGLASELALADAAAAERLGSEAPALVQSTLLYNLLKSDSLLARVDQHVARLEATAATLESPVLKSQLELVLMHARTVTRQQNLVNPLISRLTSTELDRAALELTSAYTRAFEQEVRSANRYRIALYASVVALLIAVMIFGVKLRELYQDLERLVSERTDRLQKALRELWGEMELAKKIQTALVPVKPELKDCEVAAVMLPAEQVGGDYYDVVSVDGQEWVFIGDVSGHGVPAGLVMMMCQTAVHTVLELDPKIAPDKLLTVVNRALTENIHKLGEDKYMTINALFRAPDGRFYFSGLHQDIFIYRARLGTVEEIRAEGVCLGLTKSIGDVLRGGSFALEEGDVLLLYTDGITEATRDGKMLDGQGLRDMLRELASRPASQIVEGIVNRLADYTVRDDVTALAIKQLGPKTNGSSASSLH